MGVLHTPIILFILVIGFLGTIFWIRMLIECLTKEPGQGNDKLAWVVVIAVTHVIGAAIYFFVRRPKRIAEADT
jgi:hypothetical protein